MSLSGSLYTGTSGLGNMSKALQVTSNNISNINTVGFKKGNTTFADTLYRTIGTQAGAAQVGLGMSVENVTQNFSDGSPQTTGNATDLAIGGDGFFIVSQVGSDETYYTRAGNFFFNESGALVNSGGYVLQGWNVDEEGDSIGAITDLILTEFTSSPEKTKEMTVITNLDSDANANPSVLSNKYEYKAGETTTVTSDTYEHACPVTVYDSLGSAHEVTVYYDKKSGTTWEYIIVCDPEEDNRALVQGSSSQGLLARGTIEFSENSGHIISMTMEEFTGRVGNVATAGNNTVDDINFEIEDSEAMLVDGYGIEMTFDGSKWVLNTAGLPDNYKNAEIIYSDDQNIHLVLDPTSSGGTEEADLKIKLDKNAMAGDTLSFDVNDTTDLHVQDLEEVFYTGDAIGNTTYGINDPSIMTRDAEGLSIIWNPVTEAWYWSNPEDAAAAGTLVTDPSTNNAAAVNTAPANMTINNAKGLTMAVEDVDLMYNAALGAWDWNQALRKADLVDEDNSFDADMTLSVITSGDEGAVATTGDIVLEWDGTQWNVTNDGGLNVTVVAAESSSTQVQVEIWDTNAAQASTIQYTFDSAVTAAGETVSFGINPTPPAEYAEADIVTTGNNSVAIDFDGNGSTDMTFNVTSGAAATLGGGETLSFDVDPDVPPAEYSNATLSGDKTEAVIDLDGSGGEDDRDDIVFTFAEDLSSGTDTHPLDDRSVITFDISGSSVWRECSTDEAKDTGYFQFSTDFLGGEYGTTGTNISLNIGSRWDGNNWVNDSLSTTQYGESSSTTYHDADGYPPGDLTGVEVSSDGTVTGTYDNGQLLALFNIALADFNNPNGLKSEGGNLYSETTDSGSAITNSAGENGLGELSSYTLEISNVDISEEFVSMIELQNGYEANAKVITTVDEMMSTVISMKR
ncbi:flagellar hook-basal body complex protein [Desulfospira joergensenii]|uniref:flagellar hook-basal body complex protein n=1 Tax=Desulfospira joergensenii TaxID=53329 RepID=UPI0003B782A1|nr:flagellar hook-basal body complex protein [Desulfospira joergensenii]